VIFEYSNIRGCPSGVTVTVILQCSVSAGLHLHKLCYFTFFRFIFLRNFTSQISPFEL